MTADDDQSFARVDWATRGRGCAWVSDSNMALRLRSDFIDLDPSFPNDW